MEFKLQLVIGEKNDNSKTIDLIKLNKFATCIEELGLSLADGKALLKSAQAVIVQEQINDYLFHRQFCRHCHQPYRIKDHKSKQLKTPHGRFFMKKIQKYTY